MEWELSVKEQSFDRAGITKDAAEAVCEYIWNGLEAGATEVTVDFIGGALREAQAIRIIDNGSGINYSSLDDTFGAFLASPKLSQTIAIKSQKNKGKGRFSYMALAQTVRWSTVFRNHEGNLFSYQITMNAAAKRSFNTSALIPIQDINTGTVVEIPISSAHIEEELCYEKMKNKLLENFSWYLYLQRKRRVRIVYFGNEVDYSSHIDMNLSKEKEITIQGHQFQIDIVVWKDRVDNGSKAYYVTDDGKLMHAESTKLNKNKVEFYHAAVVKSAYFKDVMWFEEPVVTLLPQEQRDIINEVRKTVRQLLDATLHEFLERKADEHIKGIYKRNIAPHFSNDEYGQIRRRDFERVTRGLYCAEPKIFYKLAPIQEQSLLGFLNLLLSSDERNNILEIVGQAVELSSDQRAKFADILRRTKLEHVLDLVDLLRRRNDVIAELKNIVFDMTRFANERDHIQRIIEQNYWLFGEGYQLVTADKEMMTSLKNLEDITGVTYDDEVIMSDKDRKTRMDVFLYGSQCLHDGKKECLVIELKAPSIKLTTTVFGQIEKYANTIRKEPRFLSKERKWRFITIGGIVHEDVKVKFDNFSQFGKLGLANIIDGFELFALSWDDVFTAFENRHTFLLDKLQTDLKNTVQLDESVHIPSRETVDRITDQLLQTS